MHHTWMVLGRWSHGPPRGTSHQRGRRRGWVGHVGGHCLHLELRGHEGRWSDTCKRHNHNTWESEGTAGWVTNYSPMGCGIVPMKAAGGMAIMAGAVGGASANSW